jgi:hypothetical protein
MFQTLFKFVRVWHFNNKFNLADLIISDSQLNAVTTIYNTLELLLNFGCIGFESKAIQVRNRNQALVPLADMQVTAFQS